FIEVKEHLFCQEITIYLNPTIVETTTRNYKKWGKTPFKTLRNHMKHKSTLLQKRQENKLKQKINDVKKQSKVCELKFKMNFMTSDNLKICITNRDLKSTV